MVTELCRSAGYAYAFLSTLTIGFLSSALVLPAILLWSRGAIAQVTSDGTTNTIVNSNGNNFTIINGIEKGNNLFHSFSNFSVPTGAWARFDLINTPNIKTIFSRVTGGNISNIDGLISTLNSNNAVSLFLMNPAGIVFGANARLNIGGSFLGTTANSIKFADGTEFSAVNASGTPLLTISVPVGLQLGANAGAIQVQGADLRVQTGQTLGLVGSQIDMTGAKLTAPDGHIELWAVQNAGIQMENQAQWQLTSPADTANWGTISLKQSSLVDASGINGGGINIRGRGLTVQDGSNISSTTSAGQGKGITIQTTEFAEFLGVSAPGQLLLAGVNTSVGNQFSFFPPSGPPTTGQAGNITIETNRLRLANGAWIQSSTSGNNSIAGDITIHAADVDMVGDETSFFLGIVNTIGTFISFGNNNQSGRVAVDAQRIRLLDGDRISSSLLAGNGTAGEVSIRAVESLEIRGANHYGITSAVLASIEGGATGQGGRITIDAGSLILANGGTITSGLAGANNTLFGSMPGAQGTAGSIDIRAREVQVSDPLIDTYSNSIAGITASVGNGAVGSGGTINLTADNLRVFNGGQITSSSQGQGNAGNINLQVKNIDIQGISQPLTNGQILPSAITASSTTNFNAGTINITSGTVKVRNTAEVTVSNIGSGDAGNLNITANNIFLDNKASLRSEVKGGSQGNIHLQANDVLLLRRDSNITTNATGTSTGGNIDITAGAIIAVPDEDSDIVANAVLGSGGNIQITTQGIFGLKYRPQLTPESDITASSQFGVNGTVDINNIGIDPNSGLVELPANVTDPSQQIATGCAGNQGSSFVATGRGGIPQNPLQQVTSERTWADIRDISAYRKIGEVTAQISSSPEVLVQATSWHRNAQGKIELVADKPSTQVQQPLTCAALRKI
ncbi:S-layer family protein [Nostoc sp.]|uniref:S-layer family protein n=1 Tax=Nostoc sp. TaxID=1180 RepID=UPI002FF51CE2